MNQKKAKALRRMAREEMAGDKHVVDRELKVAKVKGHYRVVNEPLSVRSMHLQLKKAYKNAQRTGVLA